MMKKISAFTVKSSTRSRFTTPVFLLLIALFCRTVKAQDSDQAIVLKKHDQPVKALAFSPDGKTLATGGDDKYIHLWDIATGGLTGSIENSFGIKMLAFAVDGSIIAACGNDVKMIDNLGKTLRLWDGYTTNVWSFSFSPDSGKMVAGSYSKSVKVWDFLTAKLLFTLEGHQRSCLPVCFDPSGKYIATGSLDKSVRLWDAATGKLISKADIHSENIFAVSFHPSGKYFASASADKTIRLWSVDSMRVIRTYTGHTGAVSDVQFSKNGLHMISCDAANKIILWEMATGKKVHVFDVHKAPVNAVRFSPDGQHFASAADDKLVLLWNIDKKLFLAGTFYEREIEEELSGSALFAPRATGEDKPDYEARREKASQYLQQLYDQYYDKYIEMLKELNPEQQNARQ